MNSVFGVLHHLQMSLQLGKIRKIGDKKFSVFTASSIFWPISRAMGVINEFGFRWFASFTDALAARYNQKKRRQKVFRFYCWQHILAHISCHWCDKLIRFSVVCIISSPEPKAHR